MISLHFLQLLQDNSFGTIDTDLFWEKMPLDKNGIGIISRGGPLVRDRNSATQELDLYSRHQTNDLLAADKLEKIWEFISENGINCTLPTTPKSNKLYQKTRIEPVSNIENLGQDETDRLMFRLSLRIKYVKQKVN